MMYYCWKTLFLNETLKLHDISQKSLYQPPSLVLNQVYPQHLDVERDHVKVAALEKGARTKNFVIYDDFKLKKLVGLHGSYKVISAL